jgi:hypothetical protein
MLTFLDDQREKTEKLLNANENFLINFASAQSLLCSSMKSRHITKYKFFTCGSSGWGAKYHGFFVKLDHLQRQMLECLVCAYQEGGKYIQLWRRFGRNYFSNYS